MALAIFTLHVAKNQAMLWSIEHYITLLLLFIFALKCILNVHWFIALVQKVHNFEIRSFFHFPTPKKPLRTNFLPSFSSTLLMMYSLFTVFLPKCNQDKQYSQVFFRWPKILRALVLKRREKIKVKLAVFLRFLRNIRFWKKGDQAIFHA